jgi:hypothetical protein
MKSARTSQHCAPGSVLPTRRDKRAYIRPVEVLVVSMLRYSRGVRKMLDASLASATLRLLFVIHFLRDWSELMTKSKDRTPLACLLLVGFTSSLIAGGREVRAQSLVVFMTANYPVSSKLVRFDSGFETYAVTSESDAAFLGTTILNGNVLVADFRVDAIQRFSTSGALLSPFALFDNPTFLESDSSGNVYTTHFSIGPAIATRFNSAGAITQTYSVSGSNELSGIDADVAGNVYVVDKSNGRLVKFAANGTLLNSIPVSRSSDDLAIDEAGNRLFLADEFAAGLGVKVFDLSGLIPVLTGSIVTPANSNIVGVHFAAESGNILAVDFGAGSNTPRGLEYSPSGTLLRQYQPTAAALASDITTLPIPEPSSLAMLLIGTLALKAGRRARQTTHLT